MEIANRWEEDENFENVGSTEKDKPYLYPYDPADPNSQKVSELSAYTGRIIGPAKLLSARAGEKIDLSTKYWYTEAPGDPLTSLGEIIAGTLLNLGAASSGIIPSGPETGMALINNVSGAQFGAFNSFLTNAFQNVDLSKPQAYLVYMYFDKEMNLDATNSGILQVGDANSLGQLSRLGITPTKDGYFYTYVTNTSQNIVAFDNMVIKRWAPKVRAVYDYYPFGLAWENPKLPDDPAGVHDHTYQDKEFQFAEFSTGHGLALYDFHARMYDPATGRWLVPDPAEQFANPYLAMANNPVSYVDPDGEFAFVVAGVIVGAYIGGAMANDHLNPGKWDFQDPNTWIGMGVGGAIGAFGGHSLMAAKGKAAFAGMSKGSAAAKAGGKKFFGSTVGGTTNAISNYDGADSFGWGTLADFGAGFGGSYVGISTKSLAAGFNAGGFANAISNIAQDGFGSAVEFAQDWVGGGFSSTLGMKYGKLNGKFTPFGTKTKLAKSGNTIVKNGLTGNAWDFAYSDWEKYRKKTWSDHLALFAVSGVTASITDAVMKQTKAFSLDMNGWQQFGEYYGRGIWGAGTSMMGYNMVGLVKSGQWYYSRGSQQNKAEQMSLKWLLNLFKP